MTIDVPIISAELDKLNTQYGGDLDDYLGPEWREVFRASLENAWTDGYTTGFANSNKFVDE